MLREGGIFCFSDSSRGFSIVTSFPFFFRSLTDTVPDSAFFTSSTALITNVCSPSGRCARSNLSRAAPSGSFSAGTENFR